MDRLEFAVRRYRQIMPQPVTTWLAFPADALRRWLVDDVCPVLEDYVRRPAFRAQATWPIQRLRRGAGTRERALIEETDAAVVACAKALTHFARLRTVRRRMDTGQDPPANEQGSTQTSAELSRVLLRQTELIGNRFWSDLVCPEDYFEPIGGWMEMRRRRGQAGEFVVAMNPDLHPGGDFVTRCLWVRVDGLCDTLRRFQAACTQLLAPPSRVLAEHWEEVERAWQVLVDESARLRQTCLQGPDQPLRDACVLLTQVYVAFQARPDVEWLGLPAPLVQRGAATMRHRFTHPGNIELAERTVAALHELRHLYRDADPQQNALDEAIATGGLVLVQYPPAVYWNGEPVRVAWGRYPRCWEFLRTLTDKARRGAVVEVRDLYGDRTVTRSALGTVFHRLKKLLPASLWRHIHSIRDPQGYRLELERTRLHLFREPGKPVTSAPGQ
jgi:hypothetical protein